MDCRLPVTVVTGALGAGKTTLVNHLIRTGDRRLAVIVNEFGDIGIDGDLIESGTEDLIELSSGCICCVVRGDLIRTLRDLLDQGRALDGIVIETTGLANPGPVIQTFYADQQLAARLRLDAVVTVVDALHGMQALERRDTQDQVALASVILLNKSDGAPDVSPLEDRLRAINPGARLHRINRGRADPDDVLDTHSFDLDALGGPDALPDAPPHDHGPGGITALCLRETAPMDEAALERWLTDLLTVHGEDILRTKGLIRTTGDPRPLAVQAVHMLIEGDRLDGRPAPQESKLVFIGHNLDTNALMAGFAACTAPTKGEPICPSS
ncbi:CobW family GTP-binding protein [Marivita sp.]|uniref:CobW family GTP-binding protein n=1 Tax=Marivita sp. TaxID=2003365 RepID=UPI003F722F71